MSRFTKGWVKAWRDTIDGDLVDNMCLFALWHWLLLTATWKPTKIIWKGRQREIPPGTVVMSPKELSDKWGCAKNTIRKWLEYLQESDRIVIESCTRGTIVTIRNWAEFQSRDQVSCTPTEHELNTDCPPTEHELTLSKESKKEEYKKKEYNTGAEESDKTSSGSVSKGSENIPESHAVAHAPAIQEKIESPPEPPQTELVLGETKVATPKKPKFDETTRQKMRGFIAAYSKAWSAKYPGNPEGIRDKALIGKLGHWIEHVAEVRAIQLVEVYLQISSFRPFVESCHDLWQFFRHLNRIGIALDSGQDSTQTDWNYIFGRTAS